VTRIVLAATNFLPSCYRHAISDTGNYKAQGRLSEDNREKMNERFLRDLDGECAKHNDLKGLECKTLARAYFKAVRIMGRQLRWDGGFSFNLDPALQF
jgi:hypothetical protein